MTGLIGWWPLHENSGNTARDLSGNGNHGTLNGGVTQGVAGKAGLTAHNFDGSNDKIDLQSLQSLDDAYSISIWCRPNAINDGNSGYIINLFENNATWIKDAGNGNIKYHHRGSGSNDNAEIDVAVSNNNWCHIMAVAEINSGDAYLFKNGELVGTAQFAGKEGYAGGDALAYDSNISSSYFNGVISDVRVYNRALSTEEIQTLYEWGSGDFARPLNDSNSSSAVSRWAFDGDATDSWGNNDGTNDGVAFVSNSIRGQAGYFANGDYVNIGNSLDFGAGSFSISTWVNPDPDDSTAYYYIVTKGNNPGYLLRINSDDTITGRVGDGTEIVDTVSRRNISNNDWHHLTYIVNRTDNNSNLYINGVQQDSADISVIGDIGNSSNFEIGRVDGTSGPYEGLIDDVRIYNKALSPSEVFELYRWGTRGIDMRKKLVNQR